MTSKRIFLHIPKAGGTSLNRVLDYYYDSDEVYQVRVDSGMVNQGSYHCLHESRKSEIRLIRGHINYGVHSDYSIDEYNYITFLRNPVERLVSLYFFAKRKPNHYLHSTLVERNTSFKDFISTKLTLEVDNWQVRQITGDIKTNFGRMTNKSFDLAIHNIENDFSFVGILEQFVKSVIVLKRLNNWTGYPKVVRLNSSAKNLVSNISDSDLALAAELNQLDIRLYNWALSRLNQSYINIVNNRTEFAKFYCHQWLNFSK